MYLENLKLKARQIFQSRPMENLQTVIFLVIVGVFLALIVLSGKEVPTEIEAPQNIERMIERK